MGVASKPFRPTLCVDFDGVVHSYDKGWQDGSIYGIVVPGFAEWAKKAAVDFDLLVYSSRCSTPEGASAIAEWLHEQLGPDLAVLLTVTNTKPPAWLTIDDRAICFRGDWAAPELDPKNMLRFKSWVSTQGK